MVIVFGVLRQPPSISLSLRSRNEIEWLRRILPRGFSKLPKHAHIPQMRNNFHFGELCSCFCCLACKLMVARVLRLRMSVIREKGRQSSPSHCRYEAATKSMSSCLLCTSSFRWILRRAPTPASLYAILRSSAGARFLYVALLDKRSQKLHGLVFAKPEVRDNLSARRRAFFLDESIH